MTRLLLLLLLSCSSIAFAAEPRSVTPTDPAVLKATSWDQDIIIGPGAYRGAKVVTKGSPKHQILPGALIEKVEFATDGHTKWKIDGALLRNCRFHGDLHTELTATNTAFEECFFHKSGRWFTQWAGTKWRFENCVFTRSFMPGGFGVHDYSVRAVACTFVGVKLPNFGLKKNPAEGVQGKDLQFVRSKFIGCEIPEKALALMVDCEFENCQFEPKKHDWSNANRKLEVKAYVTAGRVPASYVNTNLAVTFVSGPPPQPAGANLEHTLAGPRILIPWAQQTRTFAELGSIKKSASEIPVFETASAPEKLAIATQPSAPALVTPPPIAAATPPNARQPEIAASNPPAFDFFNLPVSKAPPSPPASSPAPAAAPAPLAAAPLSPVPAPAQAPSRDVRSLDELLLPVPLNLELVSAGKVNPAALDAANAVVDQNAAGKSITVRVPFRDLVAYRKDGYAFKLRGQPQPLSLRGQAVTGQVEVLFRADQSAALSRLGKGMTVLTRGVVSRAELKGEGRAVNFTVLIADGTVQ